MFKRIDKFFPVLFLSLCCSANLWAQPAQKQWLIQVQEMNCQLCAYLVNKELREVEGVQSTKASIKEGWVKVQAKAEVPAQSLLSAIEKLNYHGKVLAEQELP